MSIIDPLGDTQSSQNEKSAFCSSTHTLDDYLSIPVSNRYHRFFKWWYLMPSSMGLREWDKFHNWAEKTHPIQYFFRQTVRRYVSFKKFYISQKWHDKVVCVLSPRQKWLTNKIPNTWADKRSLMLDLNYEMIIHFVEGEKALEIVNWDAIPEQSVFRDGLLICYKWIKEDRPAMEKKSAELLDKATKSEAVTYEDRYGEYDKMEQSIDEKDTEILVWIMKNRLYFWC